MGAIRRRINRLRTIDRRSSAATIPLGATGGTAAEGKQQRPCAASPQNTCRLPVRGRRAVPAGAGSHRDCGDWKETITNTEIGKASYTVQSVINS